MPNTNLSGWHGTTILAVRKSNEVVIASDGQVSLGKQLLKVLQKKFENYLLEGSQFWLVLLDQQRMLSHC